MVVHMFMSNGCRTAGDKLVKQEAHYAETLPERSRDTSSMQHGGDMPQSAEQAAQQQQQQRCGAQ
jgi:hypothetical protein